MITKEKKIEIIKLFQTMEESLIVDDANLISIVSKCSSKKEKSEKLLAATDPIAPILRTALVINWREAAMKSRYERFRQEFQEIADLETLKVVIDSTDPLKFCKDYLNINANPQKPSENPKYRLLKALTNGFLMYKESVMAPTEIQAIRQWAENIDISDLRKDPIGKLKGVGIGVVENIRLNLGYSVVKPDRHVIGVMKQCLGINLPPESYTKFACSIGINPQYFDCVLFEYGKLKNISE